MGKCIAHGGDCVEKQCFVAEDFALSNSVVMLFVSVVVSMKINSKYYFWSNLHTYPGETDLSIAVGEATGRSLPHQK